MLLNVYNYIVLYYNLIINKGKLGKETKGHMRKFINDLFFMGSNPNWTVDDVMLSIAFALIALLSFYIFTATMLILL